MQEIKYLITPNAFTVSVDFALTVSHIDGKVGGAIPDHRSGRLKRGVREN